MKSVRRKEGGVLMAPIGAHRRILAKFRRGELRVLQVLLVSFLIRAVIFSVLRLRRPWRASHRAAYACLYIYKKVRKQNFPSGGHFFEIFFGMKGVVEKREGKAGSRQLNQTD